MTLEQIKLEEMLYSAVPDAMPSWPCPRCGASLREHTQEMIEGCTRDVREAKL
jgi:hypothetical protein